MKKQYPEISFGKNYQRLNRVLDELETQCMSVSNPKGILEHIQYFCGENGAVEELNNRNEERMVLFERIATLMYVYNRIADQFELVDCSVNYIDYIERRIDFYIFLRELIRCNVELIHLAPGLILYDSTVSLFTDYLNVIKRIQKEKYSLEGVGCLKYRLDHYAKLREIIFFSRRC